MHVLKQASKKMNNMDKQMQTNNTKYKSGETLLNKTAEKRTKNNTIIDREHDVFEGLDCSMVNSSSTFKAWT